jgi:hypothetical protein
MIFLGAGASASFDIPTMNGFTDRIAESLSDINKEWKDRLLELKSNLRTKGLRHDIEIIATALSIFSDTSTNGSYLAPFLAFSDNPIPNSQPDLTLLLNEIKKQIYKICNRFNRADANKAYSSFLKDVGSTKVSTDASEHFLSPVNYQIFTTNYDLSFNRFLETKEIEYFDGFSGGDRKGGRARFSDIWGSITSVNFGKLHGSINYYEHEDGSVARYSTSLSEEDIINEGIMDKIMIYPIGEKYATRTPYFEILSKFRATLIDEKVVIVIGYSFRDDPINNSFIDRITRFKKKNFKIILVDPDVEKIIHEYLPKVLQQAVTPVKAKFGNGNCEDLVVSAIQDRPPRDIIND